MPLGVVVSILLRDLVQDDLCVWIHDHLPMTQTAWFGNGSSAQNTLDVEDRHLRYHLLRLLQ
jgi:hypothetical protein